MILDSIEINNFRSIENLKIEPKELEDGSRTFALIGVNEAGKSSILRAISLKDKNAQASQADFRDENLPLRIIFTYRLEDKDLEKISILDADLEDGLSELDFQTLVETVEYGWVTPAKQYVETVLVNNKSEHQITIKPEKFYLFPTHNVVFWKSEDKYLINKPVNLNQFADNPENISVPLKNCFLLANYKEPKEIISKIINNPAKKKQLQDTLSRVTSSHIRKVWPGHPIKISFDIDNGILNFLVEDEGAELTKTTDQRSDGFKQFISFLLTISAEDEVGVLSNKILLLDEPETHLHPQAQMNLLDELVDISNNDRNNLAIFATHSIFMIDKDHLERHYRVSKLIDNTQLSQLVKHASTYSSVLFEVFSIYSTDYHNELYSKLHSDFINAQDSESPNGSLTHFDKVILNGKYELPQNYNYKDKPKQVTLPTFVRNCINHPEGPNSSAQDQLVESIDTLLNIRKKFNS